MLKKRLVGEDEKRRRAGEDGEEGEDGRGEVTKSTRGDSEEKEMGSNGDVRGRSVLEERRDVEKREALLETVRALRRQATRRDEGWE